MRPVFNENRYQQLLCILRDGGFLDDYVDLFERYSSYGNFDNRPKLDFATTVNLFKLSDPTVKAQKKWSMIDFGVERIGGWVWTASLVIQRQDGLEPMLKGVSADETEIVGAGWMNLADGIRKTLPDSDRKSCQDYGRPRYDGSLHAMERMVPDLAAMFNRMKELIRHGWANTDEVDPPRHEPAMP